MKTIKCDKCEKDITVNNFERHYKSCTGKKETIKVKEEWRKNDAYECPYCNLYCKNKKSIISHIWRNHTEKGKVHSPLSGKTRIAWNKGLTKETSEKVKQNGLSNKGRVGTFKGKRHKESSKKLISEKMSKNNKGGRCKWFEVERKDGVKIKVQGTWEKRFAEILNIIDENWIKPTLYHKEHSFKWLDKEHKEHTYTPDFYSPKLKKYFEIKGFWWGNDKEKMSLVLEQNKNIKIEIIKEKELKA